MFFVFLILSACKKEEKNEPQPSSSVSKPDVKTEPNADSKIVLGERKKNPYSVENMKKAFASLSQENGRLAVDEGIVRTTHLYVRFLPSNWEQYDELLRDTSLTLYNIPLDYEILVPGSIYHDPSIPEDKPTWQYTTVPVDFKFNPNIKHELISECYIPEYDTELNKISENARISSTSKSLLDLLIDEAMIVSCNPSDTLKTLGNNTRVNWNPSGTIKCLDTRLYNMIGIQGVKVIVRRWLIVKERETRTDYDGDYYFESFDRPVNYSVVFDTDEFDIRTGYAGQLKFDGPKSSDPWDLYFWSDDMNRTYCDVFRAAYRYHYGDMGGLRRPYIDSKLKYSCIAGDGEYLGEFWGNWDPTGITPDIKIWEMDGTTRRTSDQIFSTTIHETAHASHAKLIRSTTNNTLRIVNDRIFESWAVGVQWYITKMEYNERGLPNYANENYNRTGMPERLSYQHQGWTSQEIGGDYSNLFIDIVDNYDQSNRTFSTTKDNKSILFNGHKDEVSGYTLPFIEQNMLANTYELSHLRDKLKQNKPIGVSDLMIDELMNNF